jgi:hypothetical protein
MGDRNFYFGVHGHLPKTWALASGRVDWNVRPEDRIFVLLEYDHGHQAGYTDPISPLFNINSNQPWWQDQLVETHTFGPSIVNQFLLAGWRLNALFEAKNFSATLAALPTLQCDDPRTVSVTFVSLGRRFMR